MPGPRRKAVEIFDALCEQKPVELRGGGNERSEVEAPLLGGLIVEPVGKRRAEDARPAPVGALRPLQGHPPIAPGCTLTRRVRAPLAAVPFVELVHPLGIAAVTAFADLLTPDPRVEGVIAPLNRAVLAHGR